MDTPITYIIIAGSILISVLCFNNRELFEKLKHYPYAEERNKEWYRMLSSGFIHGSFVHLAVNMYVLYGFGRAVEMAFSTLFGKIGPLLFMVMYLLTIVAADIPTYLKHKNNSMFASVGASGAVSGVLFIYVLLYPWEGIGFIFLPGIDFPAFALGIGYLIYSSWASKNKRDMIDHDAHFYGALFGIVFILLSKPSVGSNFIQELIQGMPF